MNRADVIVVGGGIAGIAAALRLSELGVRVLVLETRKKLGGRATSFRDPRSGLVIDNCQHVALGCCTNYLDLCRRLGVDGKIDWQDTIYWLEQGGRVSEMRAGLLPAPSHYLGSLLGAHFLSARDKLLISGAMRAAMRTDRRRHCGSTFGRWLAAQGQSGSAVERFWSPIVVSACNLSVDRVCASVALHVIQEGFLASRESAVMGVPGAPLVELYDPALLRIERAGGGVRLGVGVEAIGERFVMSTGGERLDADRVICALPVERVVRSVEPSVRESDERFGRLGEVEHSPILGVHIAFDRPVLPFPNAVLVGCGAQWLFRKDFEGSMVHAVISAAEEWVELPEDALVGRVLADIHACLPGAEGAGILSVRAVKEKQATFAATPAFEAARPDTVGASRLILAGDYVRTGWPATMEGAARSGYRAAAAAMGDPIDVFVCSARRPAALIRLFGAPGLRDQHRPGVGAVRPLSHFDACAAEEALTAVSTRRSKAAGS